MIECEIVDRSPKIKWADIAGLDFAKKTIHEVIVWPMLRPDIFNGLRAPIRVILIIYLQRAFYFSVPQEPVKR